MENNRLLLLDSDALIKLNRAGVLVQVVGSFSCVIPMAVYEEVVTAGRAHRYPDADAIEAALANFEIVPGNATFGAGLGLGAGERAILDLLTRMQDAIVVSDDRRFLSVLSLEGAPFLTPADVLVVMNGTGVLSGPKARNGLELLRPLIRTSAYWDARNDLESSRGSSRGEK